MIICDDHHGRLVPVGGGGEVVVHEDAVHHGFVLGYEVVVGYCSEASVGDDIRACQLDLPAQRIFSYTDLLHLIVQHQEHPILS